MGGSELKMSGSGLKMSGSEWENGLVQPCYQTIRLIEPFEKVNLNKILMKKIFRKSDLLK